MKLEQAIRDCYTKELGTHFISSSGQPYAVFPASTATNSFTAEFEILRADLSRLFLESTSHLPTVKYVFGESIEALDQSGKGVKVNFRSGSQDSYDVVVAADGAASTTRAMILGEDVLKGCSDLLGQYIAFFSIPRAASDGRIWQWYNVPKGLCVMLRPHANPETMGAYLCITLPKRGMRKQEIEDALASGVEAQKALLRQYFQNAGWEAERVLNGMDGSQDFYMSTSAQVTLPKWTHGQSLVLGDAAHATFGIGTSLAIEGAYILAGELSKIKSSADIPEALERYERVFRSLEKVAEGVPPGFPQLAMPQTRWGLGVRNSLLWAVAKTRLYKLFPGDAEADCKLPDYAWKAI